MIRGRKPKPTHLHVVEGTLNATRHAERVDEPVPSGGLTRPTKLKGRGIRLWEEFIVPAWWLTAADSFKAYMWCCLAAEFEKSPNGMVASRISQLRALGSELGLDPAARARLGAGGEKKETKPEDEFFR